MNTVVVFKNLKRWINLKNNRPYEKKIKKSKRSIRKKFPETFKDIKRRTKKKSYKGKVKKVSKEYEKRGWVDSERTEKIIEFAKKELERFKNLVENKTR